MASNYKVHILFYDGEENGDILHKKVLKETIFQCINFSGIPLFVRNYNTISQNKLEARVFKYMLLKYAGIEIVAMEEQKKELLDMHIMEVCEGGMFASYDMHLVDTGVFDFRMLNEILMFKAKFEVMWYGLFAEGQDGIPCIYSNVI